MVRSQNSKNSVLVWQRMNSKVTDRECIYVYLWLPLRHHLEGPSSSPISRLRGILRMLIRLVYPVRMLAFVCISGSVTLFSFVKRQYGCSLVLLVKGLLFFIKKIFLGFSSFTPQSSPCLLPTLSFFRRGLL